MSASYSETGNSLKHLQSFTVNLDLENLEKILEPPYRPYRIPTTMTTNSKIKITVLKRLYQGCSTKPSTFSSGITVPFQYRLYHVWHETLCAMYNFLRPSYGLAINAATTPGQ